LIAPSNPSNKAAVNNCLLMGHSPLGVSYGSAVSFPVQCCDRVTAQLRAALR
jgi:hypothetical protein